MAGINKQWLTLHTTNGDISMGHPLIAANINNSFLFSSTVVGDIGLEFTSKGDQGNVSLEKNMFRANASLTKTFFNNRLSLRIAAYDIFHYKQGTKDFNQQMQTIQENRTDSRYAELTIRYTFNASSSKYKGTGAGNAEKGRL